MDPAVREIVDRPLKHLQKVKEVAAVLPTDDQELDQWIAEVIHNGDGFTLTYLLIAAVGSERPVDVRHLIPGAVLLGDAALPACLAWRMKGDAPEALLALVRETHVITYHGPALFVATAICQERRDGNYPPELLVQARILARHTKHDLAHASSLAIAGITRDAALAEVLKIKTEEDWERATTLAGQLKKIYSTHPFDAVVQERERNLADGFTLRRAVARVGRNDPCPCQSGRKYKQCCMAKDEERLRNSSHVAGKSQADLRAEPVGVLTRQSLKRKTVQDLLRIDPRKISEDVQEELLFQLSGWMYFERAVECLELLEFPERLDDICFTYAVFAARAGHKDALELLVKKHPRAEKIQEDMFISGKLLLAENDPASIAPLIEKEALAALKEDEPYAVLIFADGLLQSKYMALGILVARSAISQMDDNEHAQRLLKELLMARDRLNLPPEDVASEVLEKRWLAAAEKKEREEGAEEASALAEARERLEVKIREVQQLQQSLDGLKRDVQEREKRGQPREDGTGSRPAPDAPGSAGKSQVNAADEEKLAELRFKVEELKNVLKERHEERVSLRQELRVVYGKLESQGSAHDQEDQEAKRQEQTETEAEARHLLPEEAVEIQPLRLPEFPPNFRATLEELPRHVARSAMAMIGRLASGEAAAFQGVVRLKACSGVYRQRIGRDHRLLFRLLPGQLEVVDLINRRDLERRIKTLD